MYIIVEDFEEFLKKPFEQGVVYYTRNFTLENPDAPLDSCVNCSMCLNCVGCNSCEYCVSCSTCSGCVSCMECSNCVKAMGKEYVNGRPSDHC